jgi:hypothetical protein
MVVLMRGSGSVAGVSFTFSIWVLASIGIVLVNLVIEIIVLVILILHVPAVTVKTDAVVHVPLGLAIQFRPDEIGDLTDLFLQDKCFRPEFFIRESVQTCLSLSMVSLRSFVPNRVTSRASSKESFIALLFFMVIVLS